MLIEEQFIIIKIKNNIAYLEALSKLGCDGCSARKNCGISSLSTYFTKYSIKHHVSDSAKVNDIISITIDNKIFFKHAFLLYLLPLLILFISAYLVGIFFSHNEGLQVIVAISSLLLSFVLLRFLL